MGPGGSVVKNPPAKQEMRVPGSRTFDPWVGKIPWSVDPLMDRNLVVWSRR